MPFIFAEIIRPKKLRTINTEKMKKIVIILIGVILIFPSCKKDKVSKETLKTVKVNTVVAFGQDKTVSFPGKVNASSEVNIAFRISGPIAGINVKEGQFVKKGQVLAEMDRRDYEIQYAATEAEYKQVKSEAGRIIRLYERESVSENDYDKAVAGLQQITAKYNAHKNALSDTKLTAPFDGYIQKRYFDSNETINAGMPVFSMISNEAPEVVINIPAGEYIERSKFDSFNCYFDVYPDRVFPLDLISISHKANMNQLYTVRLKMRNEGNLQMPSPGMSTMVVISYKPEDTNLYSIPVNALFEIDAESTVWVYNEDTQKIQARRVRLYEILTDGRVVISEGLSAGEQIVTAGVNSLTDGEQVKLLPDVSPTNVGGLL